MFGGGHVWRDVCRERLWREGCLEGGMFGGKEGVLEVSMALKFGGLEVVGRFGGLEGGMEGSLEGSVQGGKLGGRFGGMKVWREGSLEEVCRFGGRYGGR